MAGLTFEGDTRAPFRGFDARPARATGRGRFFLAIDENWPERTRARRLVETGMTVDRLLDVARAAGCEGFIVPSATRSAEVDGLVGDFPTFFVDNTYSFAQKLAGIIRSASTGKLIAVTGSAGKSTTQRMIFHALNAIDGGSVLAPRGNQNYAESVLGHLSMMERRDYTALEVGNSACFDFSTAGFSIGADASIVTEISEAHLDARPPMEHVTSLRDIAMLKSAIFEGAPPEGVAVINLDAPYSDVLCERAKNEGRRVIRYGENSLAQVRLEHYDTASGSVRARTDQGELLFRVGAPGKHMAMNALAVAATLQALEVPHWEEGVAALSSFGPLIGRGRLRESRLGERRFTICDESYNANPASVRAALATFASAYAAKGRRRVIILGDMVGVGSESEKIHRDLASSVLEANADDVLLFGQATSYLHDELARRGHVSRHWGSLDELIDSLDGIIRDNDFVLTKASGSTGLGRWVSSVEVSLDGAGVEV